MASYISRKVIANVVICTPQDNLQPRLRFKHILQLLLLISATRVSRQLVRAVVVGGHLVALRLVVFRRLVFETMFLSSGHFVVVSVVRRGGFRVRLGACPPSLSIAEEPYRKCDENDCNDRARYSTCNQRGV
jgi:hypothetical protein